MPDTRESYNRIALAVGKTCAWWSILEGLVHDLILHMAACLDPAFDDEGPRDVLHIAVTNMELRERIVTAKALASQIPNAPGFYGRLEAALNRLDNDLRAERNRFVHDTWTVDDGRITRRKHGTVVTRPQAFQIELRMHAEREFETLSDIDDFVRRLGEIYGQLALIDGETAMIATDQWLRRESLKPTPEAS